APGRDRPERAPAQGAPRRPEPHRRLLPEVGRQGEPPPRRPRADRRARRDRAAPPALVRPLPALPPGTAARGAGADAPDGAVLRGAPPRGRPAPDPEERQDR